jgi:RNA polymerase sigma-70 factor (ECF subfamily)
MNARIKQVSMPPAELDDVTLVRAQRGDAAAFRALVVQYQRPVFALLGRMLARSPQPPIEDLAQETFLRVFRALPNFSTAGSAKLSTWILTITTRLALDHLRRYSPQTTPIEEAFELASDDRAEHLMERRALGQTLERAVAGLSPVYRAVFLLRECHDLSYEEIAQVVGCDIGTVKSRLLRARAALRSALSEVYDE